MQGAVLVRNSHLEHLAPDLAFLAAGGVGGPGASTPISSMVSGLFFCCLAFFGASFLPALSAAFPFLAGGSRGSGTPSAAYLIIFSVSRSSQTSCMILKVSGRSVAWRRTAFVVGPFSACEFSSPFPSLPHWMNDGSCASFQSLLTLSLACAIFAWMEALFPSTMRCRWIACSRASRLSGRLRRPPCVLRPWCVRRRSPASPPLSSARLPPARRSPRRGSR